MHIWFWAWLLLAGIFAVMELFDRQYYTLPWAFGSAAAALLEFLHVAVGWQWIAFVLVSGAVLVGIQRFQAPGRRSTRRAGRVRS